MPTGAITQYIDVAQLALYAFWIFFAGLVYYLRREDKREGYPLESDRSGAIDVKGWPAPPPPKSRLLSRGMVAGGGPDRRAVAAQPTGAWLGAPLEPTGDPMRDGVGPASHAQRADVPDLTFEGAPRIVPLRAAPGFGVDANDPDPRGMTVVGADGEAGGVVRDVWVDRSETIFRYFEVEVAAQGGPRRVLLPVNFSKLDAQRGVVNVRAITGAQFAHVPPHANPDTVTLREEDRITGYFGGGTLYATPDRREPLV
ncbi:MAG: photosynthetic reaction center subunit H [Burkholderiales bacterium]